MNTALKSITRIGSKAMSTSTPRAKEYLAIVQDKPGTMEKRIQVREKHLAAAKQNNKSGIVPFGGGIANDFPEPGQQFPFVGSALVVTADSKHDVIQLLKQDIYFTSGVWDVENAKIYAVSPK